MANKAEKFLAIRDRTLKSLRHRVETIMEFDRDTSQRKLVVSDRSLDSAWDVFTETNDALDGLIVADNVLAPMIQENLVMEDAYIEAKTILGELTQIDNSNSNQARNGTDSACDSTIKLSKLTIKPFSGKYEDWHEFKDLFDSCVTNNARIPDIQKLQHLKSLLSEEPAMYIKNLKMKDHNFEVAWKLLSDHYENKYKVVSSYLQKFLDIPTITAGSSAAADIQNMILVTNDMLTSLPDLGVDTSSWDAIVVHILVHKLDLGTMNYWHEERKASKSVPKFTQFRTFLETRQIISESKEAKRKSMPAQFHTSTPKPFIQKVQPKPSTSKTLLNRSISITCEVCGRDHRTFQCPKLINATVDARLELIRAKGLCENCLFGHHETEKCTSQFRCRACNESHHTLLHPLKLALCIKLAEESEEVDFDDAQRFEYDENAAISVSACTSETVNNGDDTQINMCTKQFESCTKALLATALVPVFTHTGGIIILRALLDQGSESSLITTRAQQLLNTDKITEHIPVTAIGNTPVGIIKHSTNLTIGSLHDSKYRYGFKALVTKMITHVNPRLMKKPIKWDHLVDLPLADPKYFEPGQIDLLFGVEEIAEIMLSGVRKGKENTPMAQLTKLGWVLSGNHAIANPTNVKCHITNTMTEETAISEQLKLFWTIEELPSKPNWSPEEQMAERKFVESVHRTSDGKLCVKLPFTMDPNDGDFLGYSFEMAKSRFVQLEKKLGRNENLRQEYSKCINEYAELKHMRLATPEELLSPNKYFLPHHAVIKETSETTKVRVVFDASAKTSNGKSLNERLCVGPTIQKDLFSIILQWRKGKIAFIGDIEKMYRQVWIVEEDAKFQSILWRDSPTEPLKQYVLRTVTFGTSSAPFQAIRALFHIADEVQETDPEIAQSLKEHFYVDDFMKSEDTVEQAVSIKNRTSDTLQRYGMNIRKWKSNSRYFLSAIAPDSHSDEVEHTFDSTCKALGLFWCPNHDQFHFKLELEQKAASVTKRKILSETARLFDPLGWLAPCIIKAKILMQQLWLLPLNWDDTLPTHVSDQWLAIKEQLLQCSNIKIDRWIGLTATIQNACIHGFADASEAAYAAVVYLRVHTDNEVRVSLLAAKTKVSPLKRKIVTLPNLELSAALLLAELITKIKSALSLNEIQTICWTDSTIVLDWLASPPHRWQTFVANRVSKIQDLISPENWKHVPTKLNPADCASRGILLNELKTHPLWWHGPDYLNLSEEHWPAKHYRNPNKVLPSTRKINHTKCLEDDEILLRFSSLNKLVQTTAYCLRWKSRHNQKFESLRLTPQEIRNALNKWLKVVQSKHFALEIKSLQRKPDEPLPKGSSIRSLIPYVDTSDGFLKVSGRLQEANIPDERKHPIILPNKSHLTKLIIQEAHLRTLHGGIQLTLQATRQNYWIIQGRNTIKSYVHSCVICFRYQKQPMRQLMGSLPKFRAQENRPFTHTGVDFAGYFDIKTSSRRNAPFSKAYVAIFICLTTKAIHLEVVSSLSTESFLMAFRRFLSRKLIPAHMYSDRGTNFVGASNELPRLFQRATAEQIAEIRQFLLTKQIEWHMIPAHAPHFGGLWEAGVKSMKYHLKRTLGETKLNFEEFSTVIAQIEACLNSRPLYPLSENSTDDVVITPNHILFGFEAATLPEPCSHEIPTNRLDRYKLMQRLRTEFWTKWSNEFLTRLQQRPKWLKRETNIRENQIVLIKEDNLPPAKWLFGRIIRVFPGRDGLVRVAEVKCKESVLSRPIHKLCVLPIVDNSVIPQPNND